MKRNLFRGRIVHCLLMCLTLFIFDIGIYAQNAITAEGTVLDKNTNEPLIGATVSEKGTTNATMTDVDGKFALKTKQNAVLVFSSVGYKSVEHQASPMMNILMEEDSKTLEDVVVVGYGVQKKVNLTGAVAAVDGAAIASKSSSDVLSAMQGEMPGVAVLRSGGKPGSETSGIRIRGVTSVNDAKALVLIDGVEGDITLLNPNDIANVSVLKDAAASSIYGARAAAGVILVTTKSGQEGKTRISYNGYFAINTPGNMPERIPAWEEQEFINESRVQASGTPEWNAEQSSWVGNPNFNYRPNNGNGRWDLFEATNWVAEGVKKSTTQQSHSISISGGSKDINYLVSAGYFKKDGILKYGPDKNDRYNIRIKLGAILNKYMELNINANYNGKFTDTNPFGAEEILDKLYRVRGRQPIYNPEGDINYKDHPYNGDLQVNAIDLMKNGGINESRYEAYVGKGELTIKNLVEGLRFKLSASRQAGYYNNKTTKATIIWYDRLGVNERNSANKPNEMSKTKNYDFHDYLEALAYYDLKINKHSFNLLAGSTYENYRKDELYANGKNFNANDFFTFNAYDASLATNSTITDKVETWAMMSYFGRLNYNFNDRYLLEANIRYDGSSRLEPTRRWKAFPSFSGAWRVSEEPWFSSNMIDNLKVRASWGQLGNGGTIGLYDYLALLSNGKLMGDQYYYQSKMAAKNKSWEIIQSTNVGLDLNMLASRLSFSADYYWKFNNDMLINYNLPNLVGIGAPAGNIGRLKSWGWEIQLGWNDKIGDVKYQVGFNLSDSQNKLLEYNGTNVITDGTVKVLEGYPLNSIWGYKTDGYWSSKQEYLDYKAANPGYQSFNDANISGGDIKYVAQGQPDHTIGKGGSTPEDPGDLVYLGNTNGRYLYGFNLSAQWKNFDISLLFQGVGQRKILIETATIAPFANSYNMPWTIHRDYWTPENTDAFWPRLYNQNTFNYYASDKWIQDASYIRLKNVQIGYNVPVKKGIVEKLRVYLSGDDIWEHSNMLKVFDPEVGQEGKFEVNNSNQSNIAKASDLYPFFRTWTVGVNITF